MKRYTFLSILFSFSLALSSLAQTTESGQESARVEGLVEFKSNQSEHIRATQWQQGEVIVVSARDEHGNQIWKREFEELGRAILAGASTSDDNMTWLFRNHGGSGLEVVRLNRSGELLATHSVELEHDELIAGFIGNTGEFMVASRLKEVTTLSFFNESGKRTETRLLTEFCSLPNGSMTLEADQNNVIAAVGCLSNNRQGIALASMDFKGKIRWVHELREEGGMIEHLSAKVRLRENGTIVLSGNKRNLASGEKGIFIVALGEHGDRLWMNGIMAPLQVKAMTIDEQHIYVCGVQEVSGGQSELAIVKYDFSGQLDWANYYAVPSFRSEVMIHSSLSQAKLQCFITAPGSRISKFEINKEDGEPQGRTTGQAEALIAGQDGFATEAGDDPPPTNGISLCTVPVTGICTRCTTSNVGNGPLGIVTGSSQMHYEVGIQLLVNSSPGYLPCIGSPVNNNNISCGNVDHGYPPVGVKNTYASLEAINGFTYWDRKQAAGNNVYYIKSTLPIIDRAYYGFNNSFCDVSNPVKWKRGAQLTLCAAGTTHNESKYLFNSNDEPGQRLALSAGVFKLHYPGMNIKPIYFAFAQWVGLLYDKNPDINIISGLTVSQLTQCGTSANTYTVSENFKTWGKPFDGVPCYVFPNSNYNFCNDPNKYIATTDLTTFSQFWNDNVITIGFMHGVDIATTAGNTIESFATSTTPLPPNLNGLNFRKKLTVNSLGEYHVVAPLPNPINPGRAIKVHIRARFTNGESINELRSITVQGTSAVSYVTVMIRGNIRDYDSSIVNYSIDVYE